MRDVERAVAEAVIAAGECDDAIFLVARIAVLSAASTASKPELQKITLPVLNFEFLVFSSCGFAQCSKVI